MSSGLLLHAIMACGNVMSLNLARTSLNLARLESSTELHTVFPHILSAETILFDRSLVKAVQEIALSRDNCVPFAQI